MAKWNASNTPEKYELHVFTKDDEDKRVHIQNSPFVVDGETSKKIEELTNNIDYFYTILAFKEKEVDGQTEKYYSEESEEISVKTLGLPELTAEVEDLDTEAKGGHSFETTFNLIGSSLTSAVTLSFDAIEVYFDVNPKTITPQSGEVYETITVKFTPDSLGEFTGSLTITSDDISNPIEIPVKGNSIYPVPVAGNASDMTISSFNANWNRSVEDENYELSVYTKDENENITPIQDSPFTVNGDLFKKIENLQPNTDYFYTVKAFRDVEVNGENIRFESEESEEITLKTLSDVPALSADEESLTIAALTGESNTATFNLTGSKLTTAITLSFVETDVPFTVTPANITPATDGTVDEEITVTFSPTDFGKFEATLNITTNDITDAIEINVTGNTTYPAPVAEAATEVKDVSFTANWQASVAPETYKLSVYTKEENSAEQQITGSPFDVNETSKEITGLTPETVYFYKVKAVKTVGSETMESLVSNEIEVTTLSRTGIRGYELDDNLTVYPNPATDMVYVEGCKVLKATIFDLTGKSILESGMSNQIKVNGLPVGAYVLQIQTEEGIRTTKINVE